MKGKEDDIAVSVTHVSKDFRLPDDSQNSLKGRIINFNKRGYSVQHTLKDVSFDIKKGEFFGIVGRNGSGKSTLLKLISGIYHPTKGNIQVNGKLTPFIELGVGFNPELSGRDNVFLNGALLGFNRSEMLAMYDEIVGFAELERFMDQKLKNYSSGMQVRLAFSIAIRTNTDILVLDEVLAVGDANFQRKCLNYFKQLKVHKKTVVFVSHDMAAVQDFCDKAIIIDTGKIVFEGDPIQAGALYNDLNFGDEKKAREEKVDTVEHFGSGAVCIKSVALEKAGKITRHLKPRESFSIRIEMSATEALKKPVIGVQIHDTADNIIYSFNSVAEGADMSIEKGESRVLYIDMENIYHNGSYSISVAVKSRDKSLLYDQVLRQSQFDVSGWKAATAFVHPRVHVRLGE